MDSHAGHNPAETSHDRGCRSQLVVDGYIAVHLPVHNGELSCEAEADVQGLSGSPFVRQPLVTHRCMVSTGRCSFSGCFDGWGAVH